MSHCGHACDEPELSLSDTSRVGLFAAQDLGEVFADRDEDGETA